MDGLFEGPIGRHFIFNYHFRDDGIHITSMYLTVGQRRLRAHEEWGFLYNNSDIVTLFHLTTMTMVILFVPLHALLLPKG